jgi:hypothetical protein
MSTTQSLIALVLLLCTVNGAYIRRDEFTKGSGCVESQRYKSAYYLLDICAPPANVKYNYYQGSDRPIQVQYFSDNTCQNTQWSPSTFQENECVSGTGSDYSHVYVDSLPALQSGQTTYSIYDRSKTGCTGTLQYLVQATSVCYANADGSYQSARTVCKDGQQSLTKCTDMNCSQGCTTIQSTLTNQCSASDHDINSCGAPSAGVGGSGSNSGTTSVNGTVVDPQGAGNSAGSLLTVSVTLFSILVFAALSL